MNYYFYPQEVIFQESGREKKGQRGCCRSVVLVGACIYIYDRARCRSPLLLFNVNTRNSEECNIHFVIYVVQKQQSRNKCSLRTSGMN